MATPTILFKRGPAAAILNANLKSGEPGFTTDRYDFYIGGDGTGANQRFFGSARYWTRETASSAATLNFYGQTGVASSYISLRGPASPSGVGTYTLPDTSTIVDNYFLKVSTGGQLSWAAVNTSSLTNASLTGLTTITGTLDAQANAVFAGIVTFTQPIVGTISTATRALTVDATENDTLTGSLLFAVGTGATSVLRDDQLTYDASANLLTTAGDIAVNGGDVTTTAATATVFNSNATTVNAFGAATALTMGASTGVATISNATLTLPNATTVNVNGANPTLASSSTGTLSLFNSNITAVNEYGAATAIVMGATTGVATIRNATVAMPNATTLSIDGANPTLSGTSTGTLTLFNTNLTKVNAFQAATDIVLAATTGVTTIRNSLNVNGNVTLGDASGDTITVNGTATFGPAITGTISTATRALTVDATENDTLTGSLLFAVGTGATSVLRDDQLTYDASANLLTTAGDIAVNGGDVTTTAATATVFNSNATNVGAFGAATALTMGANSGIATINNTTLSLPNATSVTVNGASPTISGTSTGTLTLFNTNLTGVNAFGAATALTMGASTGVATISNATLSLPNATSVTVNGANPTLSGTSTGTLTLFNTNLTGVNAFGAATSVLIGASTGITTIRNSLRITNSLYDSTNSAGTSGQFLTVTGAGIGWTTISGVTAGAISTATRAFTVDSNSTGDSGTYYPTFFNSTTTGVATSVYVDAGISFDASANTLTLGGNLNVNGGTVATTAATASVFNSNATTVNAFGAATALVFGQTTGVTTVRNKLAVGGNLEVDGNNIQSSTGANVITLNNTDATFANNVVVAGNLTVNGTTTQVNTQELQVYDRTITLGITSGITSTSTSWDLGVMMNYGDAGIARTAGMIWEYANRRFQFASSADNPSAGISTTVPQITVATFAPIEIGALWVNDTAGQHAVISYQGAGAVYSGSTAGRYLQDIIVDGGIFS